MSKPQALGTIKRNRRPIKGKKQQEVEARRVEVFDMKMQGYTRREMATQLGVSPSTIKNDLSVIRKQNAARITEYEHNEFVGMSLRMFEKITRHAWADYKEAKDSKKETWAARAKFLDIVRNTQKDTLKLLQDVGLLAGTASDPAIVTAGDTSPRISITPEIQKIVVQAVMNQAAGTTKAEPELNPIAASLLEVEDDDDMDGDDGKYTRH